MIWGYCQVGAGVITGFSVGVAVLSASVFTVNALLPDELIEPKWYAACLVAMAGGIVLAALRLARPGSIGFAALWRGFGAACIVVCTAQAALFLLQEADIVRSYGRFRALCCSGVVALGLALALCVKTGSSRGRWFIAMCTVELIGRRPLLGHGPGGFEAHYMNVQADWLSRHEGCPEAMLAGDVRHPLNEWLLVATDYGAVGVLAVMSLAAFAVAYARRHSSAESRDALRIMACAGVFSLFSYPLLYPFTWLMLAASIAAVFRGALSRHWLALSVAILVVSPVCFCLAVSRVSLAMELRRVQDKAMLGLSERMMAHYARLYPKLRGDSRFLYNYAAEQYEAGRYASALQTVRECGRLLASYDLCLLKGDIHRALGDRRAAMRCYRRAHWMVPSRFVPLYEMYNVAEERGDTAASRAIAREILAKPVKVPSRETLEMIEDVRRREAERRR